MTKNDNRKPSPAPVEEEEEKTIAVRYFEHAFTSKIHYFYLSDVIGPATEYVDMIHRIKTARDGEEG